MSARGLDTGVRQRVLDLLEFGGGDGEPDLLYPEAGTRVADFVIERELGRGGMGVVYLARQKGLDRAVALKLVPMPPGDCDAAAIARIEREGRILAALRHDSIVAVHAGGAVPGFRYVAMDLVEGPTLRDVIAGRAGSLPRPGQDAWLPFVLEILQRTAGALGAAHAQGIIHRDVKPENIVVDERGRPFLVDFGLARPGAPTGSTLTRGFVGTPRYASPEQTRGETLGAASDVFSFGSLAFEALTGAPAFGASSDDRVLENIRFRDLEWPSRRGLPREIRAVVEKCAEKRIADRYADAREVEEELRRVRRFEPVAAVSRGPIGRAWRRARRRPGRAAVAAAFLALAAGIGLSVSSGWRQSASLKSLEARSRLDEATRLFQIGSFADSEKILRRLVDGGDPPPGAAGRLADAALERHDPRAALALYRAEIDRGSATLADRIGREIAEADLDGSTLAEVTFVAANGPASSRDFALLAERRRRRKDLGAAIAALDECVAIEPSCFPWRLRRGLLCLRARRLRAAAEDFRAALAIRPGDAVVVHQLSWTLSKLGKAAEEEALLGAALALHPGDGRLLADLARCQRLQGRLEEATKTASRAAAAAPADPEAAFAVAACCIDARRFDEARATIDAAALRDPRDTRARYWLAALLRAQGRLAEAEAIVTPLLDDDVCRIDALALEAEIETETESGRPDDALASYRTLRALDPDNADWPWREGKLLNKRSRWKEADAAFAAALEIDPQRPDVLFPEAQVLRNSGRLFESVLTYDRALGLQPERGETYYWLADVWAELGEPGTAVRYLATALEQHASWFDAWALKGRCEAERGRLAEAEAAYRRALEIRPRHPPVSADLAEVLDKLGRDREALALYRQAREDDPTLLTAWCGEGLLRLDSDDPDVRDADEALRLIERAVALDPTSVEYRAYHERARAAASRR